MIMEELAYTGGLASTETLKKKILVISSTANLVQLWLKSFIGWWSNKLITVYVHKDL